MLDLRDVYRKVSSNLHDFTTEQLQNIQAIVGLYRGNRSVFDKTISNYFYQINENIRQLKNVATYLSDSYNVKLTNSFKRLLPKTTLASWESIIEGDDVAFTTQLATHSDSYALHYKADNLHTLSKETIDTLKKAKRGYNNFLKAINAFVKDAGKEDDLRKNKDWKSEVLDTLKEIELEFNSYSHLIDQILYFNKEASWLITRFPNAKYEDVLGLCKVVNREEIAQNDYSLTAGRYVGVAPQIDDDFDYEERMAEIKVELQSLNDEAIGLAEQIQLNLTELGL